MNPYIKVLIVVYSFVFSGGAMSKTGHSSFYFVSKNVCISKASVSLYEGKAAFTFDENLICIDMPIKLLSLQDNDLVVTTSIHETIVFDASTYKEKSKYKGGGSFFDSENNRYFYKPGIYDSGVFLESPSGGTEEILDVNVYSPIKFFPINLEQILFGDSEKLWLARGNKKPEIFIENCDYLGKWNDDEILCFDRDQRNIKFLNNNGYLVTSIPVNNNTFPVAYLPTLKKVLAVQGKVAKGKLQDYEPVLIDVSKKKIGNILETGLSMRFSVRLIAVER